MNPRASERSSHRRVIVAAGSMALVLGAIGVTVARADSQAQVHAALSVHHKGAIVREHPVIRVHGPRQVPKVGRIAPQG